MVIRSRATVSMMICGLICSVRRTFVAPTMTPPRRCPMARVIQGSHHQVDVLQRPAMVRGFRDRSDHQASVGVQDRFRGACRARSEVEGAVILIPDVSWENEGED